MSRGFRFSLAGLVVAILPATASPGAQLRDVVTDHAITSWGPRDGLQPGTIRALAQDADGYLWVGCDAGLFRFDGVRFLSARVLGVELISQAAVNALHSGRDRALWVGFGTGGGVAQIRDGVVRNYGIHDGLPQSPVMTIVEDQSGTIWVGTDEGLFRRITDTWLETPHNEGLPDEAVYTAYVDPSDDLYVASKAGIFRRRHATATFEQLESSDNRGPDSGPNSINVPRSFVRGADHGVYVADWEIGYRPLSGSAAWRDSRERGRGRQLLHDRRGNLWVGTQGQGLWRVRARGGLGAPLERLTSMTGLPSDGVFALIEDRDGNIWAGTTEGLSRLTPRRIVQLTDFGMVVAVHHSPDGSIWVGTPDELLRFPSGEFGAPTVQLQVPAGPLRAMHVDEHGTVWAATHSGVSRVQRGAMSLRIVAGTSALQQIELITSDNNGGVWLYDLAHGLKHWSNGDLVSTGASVPPNASISAMFADGLGRLWIALSDGRLACAHNNSTQLFGEQDGYSAGVGRHIYQDLLGNVWIAASGGLIRFRAGQFSSLRSGTRFPPTDLTAVMRDGNGSLWVGTSTGIIRVAAQEFDAALADPRHVVRYRLFDRSDGLAGLPLASYSNQRVAQMNDGRLLFVTARGLTLIDPRILSDPKDPAPIKVDYVTVDDQTIKPRQSERLPAGSARLEIAYTESNLTNPLRTRFRHKLDGFDRDWVDAGSRRQAFYTNLPPKDYTFRVIASRPDGTWSDAGALWQFSIAPVFYQTRWFYVLSFGGLALMFWVTWQLRLQQVRREHSLVLTERVRLSRELHDTLLQSMVGAALQFDAIASEIENMAPGTQQRFNRVRSHIEDSVRSARQSIWELRHPDAGKRDFVAALHEEGQHVSEMNGVGFELSLTGQPSACTQKMGAQLLRIGREAILNAARHAHASKIKVLVDYQPGTIGLRVVDNGRGFDVARFTEHSMDHYGLVSMKERARELRAVFNIESGHNGTEVSLLVHLDR